jgi:hypothetical protein
MITGLLKRILAIHLQWCLNPISNIPLNPFYIDFNVASSESILSRKSVMHLMGREPLEMTRRYVEQVASKVTLLRVRHSPVDRLVAQNGLILLTMENQGGHSKPLNEISNVYLIA